jgi:predicted GNAT superfamily acetyltransferase
MLFLVRNLSTYAEFLTVHELQRLIWGQADPAFALYPPLMNTAAKNGGVILGAFDANSEQMVGFLFGFLGREGDGPFKLCSQIMGVLPDWRGKGIAEALKQAQREQVIRQGLPLITWTFDPLEGPNAHLNLHKLRAVSRTYWFDLYGSNFGRLNAGLPTDRLMTEWWVKGAHLFATAPVNTDNAASIFTLAGQGIKKHVVEVDTGLTTDTLYLESVADIQALKLADISLAMDWRLKMRTAFEHYFGCGYVATDFISRIDPDTGERTNRYLLQKLTTTLARQIGIEL